MTGEPPQPGDVAAFYEAGYATQDPARAALYGRWRALGANGKAGHVVTLCGRSPARPATVVELGCGDGALLAALAARGLAVHHGVAHLTPGNADGDVARRLDVPRGTLLLTIDQVDSTADGVAVLASREHHLADAFTFTVLRRGPGEAVEEET